MKRNTVAFYSKFTTIFVMNITHVAQTLQQNEKMIWHKMYPFVHSKLKYYRTTVVNCYCDNFGASDIVSGAYSLALPSMMQ